MNNKPVAIQPPAASKPKYIPTIEHLVTQVNLSYHRVHYTHSGCCEDGYNRNDLKYERRGYLGFSISMLSDFESNALKKFLTAHKPYYWKSNARKFNDSLALIDYIEGNCYSVWCKDEHHRAKFVTFMDSINTRKQAILIKHVPKTIPEILKGRNYLFIQGSTNCCLSHDLTDEGDILLLKLSL